MMRKIKKVLGTVLLSAMVFSVAGNTSVLANNCSDTNFSFTFSNAQKYTSKMYMKCNSIAQNASYTAHAAGCKKANASTVIDCSKGYTYTFKKAGQYYYMTNWVKEKGYGYACVACSPNYGYKFSASGVWSPDNVNKY